MGDEFTASSRYAGDEAWTEWFDICSVSGCSEEHAAKLRAQVASAINAIVQTARLPDGSRKVVSISEVLPLEAGQYRTREIYAWKTESVSPDGTLRGHHERRETPTFAEEAKMMNLPL